MRILLTIAIILGLGILLQTTLISRINLLSGNADLLLVILSAWSLQEKVRFAWLWAVVMGMVVGSISGAPWLIYFVVYLSVVGMARVLTRRIWQAPLLAMFAVTFLGSLLIALLSYLYRILFENISLAFGDVFVQIILPSILLNLLLAVAVHPVMRDLARRLYPEAAAA